MRITVDVLGPLASGMSKKEILNDFFRSHARGYSRLFGLCCG